MSPSDLDELKSRIEAALAESVQEFGGGDPLVVAPGRIVVPHDRLWAFVNVSDVRAILTDRAVKTLGADVVATVDEDGVTLEQFARVTVKGDASVKVDASSLIAPPEAAWKA